MRKQSFMALMAKIDWQPKPAVFQLSPNLEWARHSDWPFIDPKERDRIKYEIYKHYGLHHQASDEWYAYFGKAGSIFKTSPEA